MAGAILCTAARRPWTVSVVRIGGRTPCSDWSLAPILAGKEAMQYGRWCYGEAQHYGRAVGRLGTDGRWRLCPGPGGAGGVLECRGRTDHRLPGRRGVGPPLLRDLRQ